MKKTYIQPVSEYESMLNMILPIAQSLNGNTGDNTIPSGDDDTGGNGNPDAKSRDNLDGWGNLW